MASHQVGSVPAKLSFAKVAAMRAPAAQPASSNPMDETNPRSFEGNNAHNKNPSNIKLPPPATKRQNEPSLGSREQRTQSEYVTNAIKGLSLGKTATVPPRGPQSAESGESIEDDQSHLSSSSTKQQSFDTKSMASVTTFAMDEKESIRPDDSASVRAAEDDETPNAASRESSLQRDIEPSAPEQQMVTRPNTSGVTIAARRYHTLTLTNPPRFGDLPIPIVQEQPITEQTASGNSNMQPSDSDDRTSTLPLAPDEKLLDALANPKDRLPLLQLEERFLGFIASPESEFLDLPPQNSFARLLSHKLADYYSLAHHINEDGTSIRLFRTPCVSLPTPLHVLAQSIPAGQAPAPSATAVKIMRRAGLALRQGSGGGSTPASSSVPSKATSEAGLDASIEEGIMSIDGTPNKDKSKLTREEREAQYKAARERIFGDFQESVTSESASTGENSGSMSRSSSSSGKRKTRKHKTPKDDSFEARSAFVPSYAPMHMQHMAPNYQPHYTEQAYQGSYQSHANGYNAGVNYGTTPTQSFPGFEPSMPYNNSMGYVPGNNQQYGQSDPWSTVQSPLAAEFYNYPASSPSYQQNGSPMITHMSGQFMPPAPSGMQQPQNWMSGQYQSSYQPPPAPTSSNTNGWANFPSSTALGNTTSYGYGQLSPQNYAGTSVYNAQHPVPGSYSRSLFNPQTRSFIPNNAPNRVGGRNVRRKPSPSSSQGRANNASKPTTSDSSVPATLSPPRRFDRGQNIPSLLNQQTDSLHQKYGAPAHLPKKPPPSQVPSAYDVDSVTTTSSTTPASVNGGADIGASGESSA